MRYRKRPIHVDAVQWNGANVDEIEAFCPVVVVEIGDTAVITIPTLEGNHVALHGDFIIKGVAGEFYPCRPDIFAATYEPVEGEGREDA